MASKPAGLAIGLALAAVTAVGGVVIAAPFHAGTSTAAVSRDQRNAAIDASDLHLAATAIASQAVSAKALAAMPPELDARPAAALLSAVYATLQQARRDDPSLEPRDSRALMGPVPFNLTHQVHLQQIHPRVMSTHTLRLFRHAVAVGGSGGLGLGRMHDAVVPARPQPSDGVYVNPALPAIPANASVAAVAIHAALTRLGDPYVWAAAGPDTFDCSGLVRWAFGKAGIALPHYTGFQWEQGRLIPPRDVLPGDLILFYRNLSHIGIYLGAGWMLNAPYTGQYVNVVPVHGLVSGIVRP